MPAASMDHVIHFLRRNAVAAGGEQDGELLRRFVAAGEGTAFAGLVRRHGPMVLGVCRRVLGNAHDAEDAFQATFLVLARKAGSVRKPDALAHWLYGVAYRVALKTRKGAPRRPGTDVVPEQPSSSDPVAEAAEGELRPLIDEELNRLPEKYRAPLVLCYLEGRTYEEAARLLGWTKGTVSGRLARARDLLRPRLARRGVALSAGLALLLTRSAAPAALVETTVRAVLAGGASAPAAALAQGVIRAMCVSQMKTWTAVVAALGLVAAGAGALWQYAPAAGADEEVRRAPPGAAEDRPAKERPGVLFTVPDDPKAEADDLQKLQGTWKAVALEHNGEKLAAEAAKKFRLVIRNDTITFNPDTAKRVAQFKLGPSQRPKAIWLTPLGAPDKSPPVRGIYALEEGRLRLCVDNDEGKATPAEFATKADSGLTLIVLERDADGDKVVEARPLDQAPRTLIGSGAPLRAVAFSPDGRVVAACAEDGSVYGWDAATGKVRYRTVGDSQTCRSLAFSADGKFLAVAGSRTQKQSEVGLVEVAQASTGKLVLDINEHGDATTAVAISPDGKHLVSTGGDGTIRLYDLGKGERRLGWGGHKGAIAAVAFSPDGRHLATGGADKAVHVWDVATGKQLRTILHHAGEVTVVGFSPDGRWLLTGARDGKARLWDTATGKEAVRIEAHKKGVSSAAFSPDGKLLATAGADGAVKLWEAATGKELAAFAADTKEVRGVAFSPDGKAIASGGADGMVRLWEVGK